MQKCAKSFSKCAKIVFGAHLLQKWIDLRQTKNKIITSPFYIYRGNTSGNALFFVIFVRSYMGGPHVAAAAWQCTYLFISESANYQVDQ